MLQEQHRGSSLAKLLESHFKPAKVYRLASPAHPNFQNKYSAFRISSNTSAEQEASSTGKTEATKPLLKPINIARNFEDRSKIGCRCSNLTLCTLSV